MRGDRRPATAVEHFDTVIVGGGSAGCVWPTASVPTRDAGSWSWRPGDGRLVDVLVHMPAAFSFPLGNRFYDWRYRSEPESGMDGREIYHARGKLLGGSSSINGMIFQRGNPLDYDGWAQQPGLERWSYAHCLPYFKRMEACDQGEDAYRGREGAAQAGARARPGPLFDAFFAAVQQAGHPPDRRRERLPPGGLRPLPIATCAAACAGAPPGLPPTRERRRNLDVRCRASPSASSSRDGGPWAWSTCAAAVASGSTRTR